MSTRGTEGCAIWYLVAAVAGLSGAACSVNSASGGDAGNSTPSGMGAGDDGSGGSPDGTEDSGASGDAGSPDEASADGGYGSLATTATMFLSNTLAGVVDRYALAPGMDPIPNGTISLPSGGTQTASGMAMSTWGELFVEDIAAGSIYRFLSPLGTPVANGTITGVGPGQELRFIDSKLWLVSTSLVQVSFDAQENASGVSNVVGAGSSSANRGMLWVPATRDLYESQTVNTIQHYRVGTDYSITQQAAITGDGLNDPGGMAIAPWGEMFVANGNGNNILRFNLDAQGNATPNGTITDASLSIPYGVAFTPWGELVVVNQHSATLSRFSFDSSHAPVLIGTHALSGPTSLDNGGFAWILIVPGASSNLLGDGGTTDGGAVTDGAAE